MSNPLGYASARMTIDRGPDLIHITIPIYVALVERIAHGVGGLGLAGLLIVAAFQPDAWSTGRPPAFWMRAVALGVAASMVLVFWSRMRKHGRTVEMTISNGVLESCTPGFRGTSVEVYPLRAYREAAVRHVEDGLQLVLRRRDESLSRVLVQGDDFSEEDLKSAVDVINEAIAATPT
jgi:hypothetical protein